LKDQVPNICCLNKLASERGRICAGSKALFAVMSLVLALAQQFSQHIRSKKMVECCLA